MKRAVTSIKRLSQPKVTSREEDKRLSTLPSLSSRTHLTLGHPSSQTQWAPEGPGVIGCTGKSLPGQRAGARRAESGHARAQSPREPSGKMRGAARRRPPARAEGQVRERGPRIVRTSSCNTISHSRSSGPTRRVLPGARGKSYTPLTFGPPSTK